MRRRSINAAELTIDLGRLRENYNTLVEVLAGTPLAAMVKANAYGLGVVPVCRTLWSEGCSRFFVAQLDEGVELRMHLPKAEIHVLNGVLPGTESDLRASELIPVLNGLKQIELWRAEAKRAGQSLRAALHFDTGLHRLGIPREEAQVLSGDRSLLEGIDVQHVMSHLASADIAESELSEEQLVRFDQIRVLFPQGSASLANSAGIFRGGEFHFDLGRPGIALYGGSPVPDGPNPMVPVVTAEVPLLQVSGADTGDTVGYGATHTVEGPRRIGTIGAGYADGFLRSGSNSARVWVSGHMVPVVGRVSMDLITIDVTEVPEKDLYLGAPVELIGANCLVDDAAVRAGTISYEMLTDLGRRYRRRYVGDGDTSEGSEGFE